MIVTPQSLRHHVDGNGPAVVSALLVDPLPEVSDDEIGLHLKVRHRTFEVLFAALAESGGLLALVGKPLVLDRKAVHDALTVHGGQLLVPAAVEVVAVPPPVGKPGEPCFGDEPGLFIKELAVG